MTTAEVTAERNNILECIDSLKRTLDDEEDPELQLVLEQSIKDEKIKLKEYTSTSSVSGGKRRARSTKKQRQTQLKKGSKQFEMKKSVNKRNEKQLSKRQKRSP